MLRKEICDLILRFKNSILQNIYIQRINRHTISFNLAIQDSATSSCPSAHSLIRTLAYPCCCNNVPAAGGFTTERILSHSWRPKVWGRVLTSRVSGLFWCCFVMVSFCLSFHMAVAQMTLLPHLSSSHSHRAQTPSSRTVRFPCFCGFVFPQPNPSMLNGCGSNFTD